MLQIGYNLLERDADDLLHFAKQENIGTLIRVSVGEGDVDGQVFPEQRNPEEDVRYERFNRQGSIDAFSKLPALGFLAENTDARWFKRHYVLHLITPGPLALSPVRKRYNRLNKMQLPSMYRPSLNLSCKGHLPSLTPLIYLIGARTDSAGKLDERSAHPPIPRSAPTEMD